jgi:hypothetical protein
MNHEGFPAFDDRTIFAGDLKVSSGELVSLVPLGGTLKISTRFETGNFSSVARRPGIPAAAPDNISLFG